MDMVKEMTARGVAKYGMITVPENEANAVGLEITKNGEIMRLTLASKSPITSPSQLDGVALLLKDWAEEKAAK
jgi:hypothetical protein